MSHISVRWFNARPLLPVGAALLLASVGLPVHAAGLLKVEQTIFGMDCAPCAAGIQKGVMALPGVKRATVNLNTGQASIVLAADSPTTLQQIRTVILHHGFTPRQAIVTAAGRIVKDGGQYYLNLDNNVRYQLLFPADKKALIPPMGQDAIVSGKISTPNAGAAPAPVLIVESVKPVNS